MNENDWSKGEKSLKVERILAIAPHFIGQTKSIVYTLDGKIKSEETPKQLIEQLCLRDFSTKEGRKQAVKKLFGYEKKIPILIQPCEIGAFPTTSSKNPNCCYIFQHPFHMKEKEKGHMILRLLNGEQLEVYASRYSLRQQSYKLQHILMTCRYLMKEDLGSLTYSLKFDKTLSEWMK